MPNLSGNSLTTTRNGRFLLFGVLYFAQGAIATYVLVFNNLYLRAFGAAAWQLSLLNGLLVPWATPTLEGNYNSKGLSPTSGDGVATQMRGATALSGQTPNGSPAATARRGAPNPEFACWLMGFPDVWVSGASQAMRSFRSSRRKFSRR